VKPTYQVELYREESGYCQVETWLKKLAKSNPKTAAKAVWLLDLLAAEGPALAAPYVKHIEGPIWELRAKRGTDAIRIYYWRQGRALFVAAAGEVKQQDRADPALVSYALKAHADYSEEE
jgi:hypothetical protein